MDASSEVAAELLDAMVKVKQQLYEISKFPKARLRVLKTSCSFSAETCPLEGEWAGFVGVMSGWVAAERADGWTLTWLIDIHKNDTAWRIVRRVEVDYREGGKTLRDFPDIEAYDFPSFLNLLSEATEELRETAGFIDTVD